jgi:imidazolonepropionase-like amidohydrolase
MRWTTRLALAVLAFSLGNSLGTAGAFAAPVPATVSDSFAITNARVFDGTQVIPSATVVVVNGRIDSVGPNAVPPQGIPVIDAAGSTLMPGIIDSHSHARSRQELERALQFGVTTEMDMWTLPQFAASMRREQERNGAPYRADFFFLLTPPIASNITARNIQIAKDNVRRLHEAGIPILTGTDVPTHGLSIHRDLELLVQAGLEPIDALTGATSAAADAFRLADRGRIAPGLRADLLLLNGDPTADIKATRKIQRIWKAGVEFERQVPSGPPAH